METRMIVADHAAIRPRADSTRADSHRAHRPTQSKRPAIPTGMPSNTTIRVTRPGSAPEREADTDLFRPLETRYDVTP